ncbi:MAG: VOC family protein [Chloroflexota bacterium]|nr:VOC family protein [Chloroflexota bacterium]
MTDSMVATTLKVGHVGINVRDLARSLAFYQDVFGLQMVGEGTEPDRRFAFLGDGQGVTVTLWQQSDSAFAPRSAGLHHLAFQVANVEAIQAVYEKLKAKNVRFLHDGIVGHAEGAASGGIYFEDPDGVRLEIYAPTGLSEYAPAEGVSCGFF